MLSPREWSLSRSVFIAVVAALSVASGLTVTLSSLFFDAWLPWNAPNKNLGIDDVFKLSFAIVAGIAGTQALVVAYRRQRDSERDPTRFTERFGSAASQLGSSDATGRHAGVYAMAALADEWSARRQECVGVLCAYMRLPMDLTDAGETEVRRSITRVLAEHLSQDAPVSWAGMDIDLRGATLIEGEFEAVRYTGTVDFSRSRWIGRTLFDGATFAHRTSFEGARFMGECRFKGCTFESTANFASVDFEDRAVFDGTTFDGAVDMRAHSFEKGASFNHARFEREADFSRTTFGDRMEFDTTHFCGRVKFTESTFRGDGFFNRSVFKSGAEFQQVEFLAGSAFQFTTFDGALANFVADFGRSVFHRGGEFLEVRVTQKSNFSNAKFNEYADFQGAQLEHALFCDVRFLGDVSFKDATFSSNLNLGNATMGSTPNVDDATFSGGVMADGLKIGADPDRYQSIVERIFGDNA